MTLDKHQRDLAKCRDSKEAYALAFSPHVREMNLMIAQYCIGCPIKADCLLEGIRTDSYGVWGGTTREFRQGPLMAMRKYLVK